MNHRITRIAAVTTLTLAAAVLLLHAQATRPATHPEGEKFNTPLGVQVIRTRAGEGARDGDAIFFHYTGKFPDGAKFDSSYDRGQPADLILGQGTVIAGLEDGLRGMLVGERRTLTIPPNLAYGEAGRAPKIPSNATLVFDVEMMGIQRK